jgi:anaerobic selenocysteine-containing dehydrogenase
MGFEDECFNESIDEMIDTALSSRNPWLKGINRELLEREGHRRLNFEGKEETEHHYRHLDPHPFLPFANGGFQTPSGKAELYNPELIAQGLDPVAEFVPPRESRHTQDQSSLPLELLARKADNYLNSTFSNLASVQELEEPGLLEIHIQDAQPRGIQNGDPVRVFNRRGEMVLQAHINRAVQPGVVAAKLNWAKLSAGGSNINTLTSEKLTDMGNSATFYSVLVEVELAKPTP